MTRMPMTDLEPGPQPTPAAAGRALYVFCLARAGAVARLAWADLVPDLALNLMTVRDVIAVTTSVNLNDYCGPDAEAHMGDLSWIGPRACRHEAVVECAMSAAPVVPARLATLFSSRHRLVAWIEEHYSVVVEALDRFAEHQEWAVKGAVNTAEAEAPLLTAALARASLPAAPGARYLQERRIRAGIGMELRAWVARTCEEVTQELSAFAVDMRERPLGPHVVKETSTPIMNHAFLVPRSLVDAFRARVAQVDALYAERGTTISCSGPWPPYSFCPQLGE